MMMMMMMVTSFMARFKLTNCENGNKTDVLGLTPYTRACLKKPNIPKTVKIFTVSYVLQELTAKSQHPATCQYPEPHESKPRSPILFPYDPLYKYSPIHV